MSPFGRRQQPSQSHRSPEERERARREREARRAAREGRPLPPEPPAEAAWVDEPAEEPVAEVPPVPAWEEERQKEIALAEAEEGFETKKPKPKSMTWRVINPSSRYGPKILRK